MKLKIKLLKNGLCCATMHCVNKYRNASEGMSLENFRHIGVYKGGRVGYSTHEKRKAMAYLIEMELLVAYRDGEGVERCRINPLISFKNVIHDGCNCMAITWKEK